MKIDIVQTKSFLKDLLRAQKNAKRHNKNLINISEKFTPEECKQIIGDKAEEISSMADLWNTQFRAEIVDEKTRNAILSMGSRSVYVDMFKTSPQEMDNLVIDLIKYPYKIFT